MENGDRAPPRGRAASCGLRRRDRVLRRGSRRREPRQRRRRKKRRHSTRCGRGRCVRLVTRARGPLRERQPDGVARFSSAARFPFVYRGARQISRCFARRDCDGCDRDRDSCATLVSGLRSRRFSVCALRKASDTGRRTAESTAGAAGLRLLSDSADACRALNIICVHKLKTTQHLGAATKADYPSRSPLTGCVRVRGLAEPSATAVSDTSRRQRPWRPMPGNITAAARPGQQRPRRE